MDSFKQSRVSQKEGLEESTKRIVQLLQTRGKMSFKDIQSELGIDYRRAYDILNVLLTTPLISKSGKKGENNLPYVYQDGAALSEPVAIDTLQIELEGSQRANELSRRRIARMEEELSKPSPDLQKLFREFECEDPTIHYDPLYREMLYASTLNN